MMRIIRHVCSCRVYFKAVTKKQKCIWSTTEGRSTFCFLNYNNICYQHLKPKIFLGLGKFELLLLTPVDCYCYNASTRSHHCIVFRLNKQLFPVKVLFTLYTTSDNYWVKEQQINKGANTAGKNRDTSLGQLRRAKTEGLLVFHQIASKTLSK